MDDIDFDAYYTVDGYRGIAFYLKGFATTEEYEGDIIICPDDECDHSMSEMCWAMGDVSIVIDYDNVIAVMVGDDRDHVIPVEDLTLLNEDEFCHGCGQVGCGH